MTGAYDCARQPPAKQEKQDRRSGEILMQQLADKLYRMSRLAKESPSLDTHWSRILYHDLFSEPADGVASGTDASTDDDPVSPASDSGNHRARGQLAAIAVATNVHRDDADSQSGRSPIAAAVILLGVFIAAYLAVAGLVRVLSGPDTTSVAMRQTGVTGAQSVCSPGERCARVSFLRNSHA